jgi:hypothetical protein
MSMRMKLKLILETKAIKAWAGYNWCKEGSTTGLSKTLQLTQNNWFL